MKLRLPSFSSYPAGWLAVGAAVVGTIVALAMRVDPLLNADSHSYVALARSVLQGQGFKYIEPMMPDLELYAFRSPVYAAFLALGLGMGGGAVAVGLQGALNGLSAVLVGGIAGHLLGARAAWIAFAIRLVWPISWFYAAQFMTEGLFEFLTVLATWLVVTAIARQRLRWVVAAGVVACLAALTRPVGLGVALALAIWLLLSYRRAVLVFALAGLIAWAPWPIRNAQKLDAFVPLFTIGGATAWLSATESPPPIVWKDMATRTALGEVGMNRYYWELTVEALKERPAQTASRIARNAFTYLGPIRNRDSHVWLHRFAMLAVLPALVAPLWRRRLSLPLLVWAGQGLLLVMFTVISRYRFAAEWCVVIGAAAGLTLAMERWGGRRTAIAASVAMVACIIGTLFLAAGG